jgi:hypothetical protein
MLAYDKTLTKLIQLSVCRLSVGKSAKRSIIFYHSGPTNATTSTRTAKRKRGAGQMIRNADLTAKKMHQSIKEHKDEGLNAPNAFLILGVFPLLATAGLLVVRDDLRQEFRERWGL